MSTERTNLRNSKYNTRSKENKRRKFQQAWDLWAEKVKKSWYGWKPEKKKAKKETTNRGKRWTKMKKESDLILYILIIF